LDRQLVEQASANTIDSRAHDDRRLNPNFFSRFHDRDISRSLRIDLQRLAGFLVSIDIIFVGEDTGFKEGAGDGLVGEV
jgi:hypothetical protein